MNFAISIENKLYTNTALLEIAGFYNQTSWVGTRTYQTIGMQNPRI